MLNRLAVFSHFDKNFVVQNYVFFYLSELSKLNIDIIFVSDCDIEDKYLNKLSKYVIHSITGRHNEYDFGSYKRGFLFARENLDLNKYDELLFINDSCYAPLFPIKNMFDKMSNLNVDFWGVTSNFNSYFSNMSHIQSYFIAFKKQVFLSDLFNNFILNIKQEINKKEVIKKYEIGLTDLLNKNGFSFDVFSELSKKHYAVQLLFYKEIVTRDKVPFVKRNIPLLKAFVLPFNFKNFIIKHTSYDYSLIEKDSINKNHNSIIFFILVLYKFVARKFILFIRNLFVRISI